MDDLVKDLKTGGSVILDAAGNGQVFLITDHAWQYWEIDRVKVSTNQAANQPPFPKAELFAGAGANPSDSHGATASGNNDVFEASHGPIRVGLGDALTVVWTGGIPGTIANVVVWGRSYSRRS